MMTQPSDPADPETATLLEQRGAEVMRPGRAQLLLLAEKAKKYDQPIKVRIQPQILDAERATYMGWRDITRTLAFRDAAAVELFQRAFEDFLDLVEHIPLRTLKDHFGELRRRAEERQAELDAVARQEIAASKARMMGGGAK